MEVIDLRTNEVVAKGYERDVVYYNSNSTSIFLDNAYRVDIDDALIKRLLAKFLAPYLEGLRM